MKALSLTLLTDHDSAQLNLSKTVITPLKAFSFHQKKKNIHHSHLISLPGLKMIRLQT